MKKIVLLLLTLLTMSGCGGETQDKTSSEPEKESVKKVSAQTPATGKKVLVAYFSRTGEEYNVGRITKGNTAIVAEFIAQKTGADLFEIKPVTPYPDDYDACIELAKQEIQADARPTFANSIDNFAQYDTIFVGYPIWWSKLPRVMMTFFESNDFSGKKIIPFCTHAGSGLAGTEREIKVACPNSNVLGGVAIVGKRCQNDAESVRQEVNQWLQDIGY